MPLEMEWRIYHQLTERHAACAEIAEIEGNKERAVECWCAAALSERNAFRALIDSGAGQEDPETLGIVAQSLILLLKKSRQIDRLKLLGGECLAIQYLPEFASQKIKYILSTIGHE